MGVSGVSVGKLASSSGCGPATFGWVGLGIDHMWNKSTTGRVRTAAERLWESGCRGMGVGEKKILGKGRWEHHIRQKVSDKRCQPRTPSVIVLQIQQKLYPFFIVFFLFLYGFGPFDKG